MRESCSGATGGSSASVFGLHRGTLADEPPVAPELVATAYNTARVAGRSFNVA